MKFSLGDGNLVTIFFEIPTYEKGKKLFNAKHFLCISFTLLFS